MDLEHLGYRGPYSTVTLYGPLSDLRTPEPLGVLLRRDADAGCLQGHSADVPHPPGPPRGFVVLAADRQVQLHLVDQHLAPDQLLPVV
jgi:hypothetical protein